MGLVLGGGDEGIVVKVLNDRLDNNLCLSPLGHQRKFIEQNKDSKILTSSTRRLEEEVYYSQLSHPPFPTSEISKIVFAKIL